MLLLNNLNPNIYPVVSFCASKKNKGHGDQVDFFLFLAVQQHPIRSLEGSLTYT